MKNSANEHFRYYIHRNSLEQKELQVTLARLDEAKISSLSKLRRKRDSFVERHSRRMFLLHSNCTKEGDRRWTVKSDSSITTQRALTGVYSSENCKKSPVFKDQKLLIRRERTTTISSVQLSSSRTCRHPLIRHVTEDVIRLPSITHMQACPKQLSDATPKSKISGQSPSHSQDKETSDENDNDVTDETQEKPLHVDDKLSRTKTEIKIQSIIPGSKLELFRQLSHRVSTKSTWSYLIRNVFERLTNGQTSTAPGQQDKPLIDVYDELKSCRYLRMPLLHRIATTYSRDDNEEQGDDESDDDGHLDE